MADHERAAATQGPCSRAYRPDDVCVLYACIGFCLFVLWFLSVGISFQLRVHCSIATVTLYFENATNHLQVIEWFPFVFFSCCSLGVYTRAPSITVYNIARCRQAAYVSLAPSRLLILCTVLVDEMGWLAG